MSTPRQVPVEPYPRPNPFPSAAVARFGDLGLGADDPTVPTQAIREAQDVVTAYADATQVDQPQQGRGMVLAIVGEYGTGKTHVARYIVRRLLLTLHEDIRPLYLDAPADDMVALYRERFIPRLSEEEISARVLEYYSDVVADEMAESELTVSLASHLRAREVSADHVVRGLGLMESELMRHLRERLRVVTEREDFATVLALYARPEFRAAAWEWFRGGPPDASLVERGVTTSIESEEDALAAIGVFALLFGQQGKRFVVVFDEMEKILSSTGQGSRSGRIVNGLKRLFEIAHQTNALFILCGLPDFLETLSGEIRSRFSRVLRPGPLTSADALEYVRTVMREAFDTEEIRPFSVDGITYLTELAGGNARRVVRLSYLSYQQATTTGTDVTRPLIREVAREQFELVAPDDVRGDVERVLVRGGWRFEKEADLKPRRGRSRARSRVDFWLPMGTVGSGCGIIISQSILQSHEAEEAVIRAKPLEGTANQPLRLGVLVVNGYLSEAQRPRLEQVYARIIYRDTVRFTDELSDCIQGVMTRIDVRTREAALSRVNERLDQVIRQNLALQSDLDQLSLRVASPDSVARAAEIGLRRIFGQLSGGATDDFPTSFPKTRSVLDTVVQRLDAIVDPLDEFFVTRSTRRTASRPMPSIASSYDMAAGAACSLLLHRVILAFRRDVAAQLTAITSGDPRDLIGEVTDLIRTLDSIIESPGVLTNANALNNWATAALGPRFEDHPILDMLRQLGPDIHHSLMRDLDHLPLS